MGLGSSHKPKPRNGSASVTLDATQGRRVTVIQFDLQKNLRASTWESEWKPLLVGSDSDAGPGVEGVDEAERDGNLTINITVGKHFQTIGYAKKIAREAAEALGLQIKGRPRVLRAKRGSRKVVE